MSSNYDKIMSLNHWSENTLNQYLFGIIKINIILYTRTTRLNMTFYSIDDLFS